MHTHRDGVLTGADDVTALFFQFLVNAVSPELWFWPRQLGIILGTDKGRRSIADEN